MGFVGLRDGKHLIDGRNDFSAFQLRPDVAHKTGQQRSLFSGGTLTNKSGYKEKYDNSVDAYYRLNRYYAWINNLTTVRISMLYCTAEESERITDIQSVLDSYIRENFAKFVTGGRSLDEFDAYQEELKQLGIEELLDIYQRGYEPYIDSVFN